MRSRAADLLGELLEAPFAAFRLGVDGRIEGFERHGAFFVRVLLEEGTLAQWTTEFEGRLTTFVVVTVDVQERRGRLPDFSGGLRDREGMSPHTETSLSKADIARMASELSGKFRGRVRRKM